MTNHCDLKESHGKKFIHCHPGKTFICTERDILDLIAFCGENETNSILIYKENLAPEFYDLKSGLAGAMFQKFSNYYITAAFVGDFNDVTPRFAELIRECNRGKQLHFCASPDQAITWLTQ